MNNNKMFISLAAILPFIAPVSAAQGLAEGIWKGSLTNALGKRYKIRYNVQYQEQDNDSVSILMVNLDLEPTPDYTYQLTDIVLEEGELKFKIPRDHDTRICSLAKLDDQSYSGDCHSDMATEGETSQIIMIPPPDSET